MSHRGSHGKHGRRRATLEDIARSTTNDYDIKVSCVPRFKNAEQFIEDKLKMLSEDFRIKPTLDEVVHLYSLDTENDINLAIRGIINKHWS